MVRPSPLVAELLGTMAQVGELLRELFAEPLPADARYVGVRADQEGGEVVARFRYIVDRDQDLVADAEDNCPLTINPDQANGDGDDFGDACDLCPGIDNVRDPGETEAGEFGDLDGNGAPNGCDCDAACPLAHRPAARS